MHVLPHILKAIIEERPDRCTVSGHLARRSVFRESEDAFPSGHTLHVGALASAATQDPKFGSGSRREACRHARDLAGPLARSLR
jgi:hypothetical protein